VLGRRISSTGIGEPRGVLWFGSPVDGRSGGIIEKDFSCMFKTGGEERIFFYIWLRSGMPMSVL
jgi:hypothetical protein